MIQFELFEKPRRRRRKRLILKQIVLSSGWLLLAISQLQLNSISAAAALLQNSSISSASSEQQTFGNMSAMMQQQHQGTTHMTNTSLQAATNQDSTKQAKSASQPPIKGKLVGQPHHQQTTSSPAHITRLKNQSRQQDLQMNSSSDDSSEIQSFMTINSAPTSVHSSRDTSNPEIKSKTGSSLSSDKSISSTNQLSKQPTTKTSPNNQWKATAKETPKFLQHQYMNPTLVQQKNVMLADPYAADNSQSQLEKPSGGYSYDSSAYTHTSPLSPARHEVLLAEQLRQRQRQQQVAANYNYHQSTKGSPFADQSPRMAHSILQSSSLEQPPQQARSMASSMSQQIEQIAVQSQKPASQLPNFQQQQQQQQLIDQTNLYSTSNPSLKPPVAHHPHLHHGYTQDAFTMMPAPHLSVTGTALNPCKPLQLQHGQHVGQHHPQQQQLISQLDAPASEIPLAMPNFSAPKYLRVGDGTRLRSGLIFKVIRADSLTDCEAACTRASALANNNPSDSCRSFNYRAYFAAENCELSRHDHKQLKLEDSSQFEQNTQFDFYALDNSSSQLQSAALMMSAASSSQQLTYSPAVDLADCLDVSQSCSQDGMEFTLRTNEPFNGRIYTYGFYDSCFTDGEGSLNSILRISKSNGFPRCGTQQIGDLMTNIVVVQFNDYVQTTRDKKYNLTCYFSGPGEAVVTSNYLDTKIDERSHPIQIEHLPPQNVITSNVHLRVLYRGQPTNTIAVGDLLTFRLETRTTSGARSGETLGQQNEIFATNVLAKDPYSGRQVQLIDSRGCPIDPVNVFPELQRTPDGALESEFYAFKIPDSNFLIFQATVRTCKAPCEPVICQTSQQHAQGPKTSIGPQFYGATQSAIKGGQTSTSASYLMAPLMSGLGSHHSNSIPSWGKRRRKRRSADHATADDSGGQLASQADDDLGMGESVEHVIPIRPPSASLAGRGDNDFRQLVTTFKRPEIGEAEEEVKEMFRVYLSRAEIAKQRQLSGGGQSAPLTNLVDSFAANSNNNANQSAMGDLATIQSEFSAGSEQDLQVICLNQSNYYILIFTIISLTMIVSSILVVATLYVTTRRRKRAQFNISVLDSLPSSMF